MTDGHSAWQLILGGDAALFAIVRLSLAVSLSAVVLAALAGMPLGALLALTRFPGRSALVANAAAASVARIAVNDLKIGTIFISCRMG